MSQYPQSHSQTQGADRRAPALRPAPSDLHQNDIPDTRVSTSNIQSHPQAHRTPATPAQALKRDLASLMHRYPHVRGSEHFKAIDQIRDTFSLMGEQDANLRTRLPVDSDRDLALTIRDVMDQSQWSSDERNYLIRLKDVLWNQAYLQTQQNGRLGVSNPPAAHTQSHNARSSARELPTQPQRHDSPHREEHRGPPPEPRRRENNFSSHYTASRAPQPAPTHSTPHYARASHGVPVRPQRTTNTHTHTHTHVFVSSNSPSHTSTTPSEIQGYDKWQPTDERYLLERDEFFKHDVRSKRERFLLNVKDMGETVKKGMKFWERE
ncbi:hypothetical protein PMIN06_008473 [Paraphaeosphaeria minitans]|uniref:Uncharacterized protein n=1 Tax=Paraphaeosphaeria minitans TaxID=565426 RepID=A0A9P6GSH0_9PLEO|nr:hypothetical protein PMIN01_03048 [Paraphaeosphaeria minitans]